MAARRVFVIWTHPIFRESVRLLLEHPDIEWVGGTSDYATGKEELSNLKLDTIIVEEVEGTASAEMMEILDVSPFDVRVIGLSFADNKLSLYRREQRLVGQAEDLVRLILND